MDTHSFLSVKLKGLEVSLVITIGPIGGIVLGATWQACGEASLVYTHTHTYIYIYIYMHIHPSIWLSVCLSVCVSFANFGLAFG